MLGLSFKISGSYFCSNRVSVKFTKHLHISLFAIYKSSQLWVYSLWTPLGAPTQSSIQPFLVHFWTRHFAHLSVTIDRRPSHSLSLRLSVCPSIRPSVTLCVLLYLRPSSVHCPSLRPSARPSVRPSDHLLSFYPSVYLSLVRPSGCLSVCVHLHPVRYTVVVAMRERVTQSGYVVVSRAATIIPKHSNLLRRTDSRPFVCC